MSKITEEQLKTANENQEKLIVLGHFRPQDVYRKTSREISVVTSPN